MKKVNIFPVKPRLLFELRPPFKGVIGDRVKHTMEMDRRLAFLYRWSSMAKNGFSLINHE